jgi:DNA-binding transcriptional MerR regulator
MTKAPTSLDQARYRSAAVARMLGMPVETLRVWERRYALIQPVRSPSGQRLYSGAQVQRLSLLRQLSQCGHAIGSLVGLDDAALQAMARTHAALLPAQAPAADAAPVTGEPPPRRWSDAALADFAGLSSTIACECPQHLAQLLQRLSEFEDYSAQCQNLSPQDAELHAYLRRVTAGARREFEIALERVALHEGLLPAAPGYQRER